MSAPACLQRAAETLDAAHHARVDLAALLDQGRQLGGCDRMKLRAGRRLGERAGIGAARDGGRRGDQAHAPVDGGRRGEPRLGRDHAHHRHAAVELLAQRGQRRRRGRVAGHHEQLRAAVEQDARELAGEAEQLVRAAVAVREASGVAEIEKVLVRKRHEALVQHGEPADSGVEDGDWKRAFRGRHGRLWWHARRAAPATGRPPVRPRPAPPRPAPPEARHETSHYGTQRVEPSPGAASSGPWRALRSSRTAPGRRPSRVRRAPRGRRGPMSRPPRASRRRGRGPGARS